MGALCASEAPSTKTEANLMGSELIISSGIKDVINLQKDQLRVSGFPVDRSSGGNSSSLILPVMKEINVELLVRFYLIYSFYINKYTKNSKEKSKYDEKFYELVKISHPTPEEELKVTAFRQEYMKESNEVKKGMILLKYVFNANFIIDNINKIPLFSKDPKDIGHLIFPLTVLHKSIKGDFDRKNTKFNKTLYVIAPLDSTEEGYMKLICNKDAYFSYSVFMKGFTNQKQARDKLKKLKGLGKDRYFFFTINFPFKSDKMQSEFNYGFSISEEKNDIVKEEGDVIFNIMNTFRVVGIQNRQIDIQYGYLPYLYHSKYVERSPVGDANLIKIFELCNAVSNHYLKSQSFLFRIIGGKEDSISTSNAIMSMKENSKATTDIERENLINNHLDNNEFEAALNATQQGESVMMKAKRLEVLFKQQKYEDGKTLISEIMKTNPPKKDAKDPNIIEAYELIEYYSAMIDLKQNAYKPALKKLTTLHKAMLARYGNDYEFIGRNVIKGMEECYKKGEEKPADSTIASSNWELKNTGLILG